MADLKPLGGKAYGSIPHLPGSKRGPADKGLTEHQSAILTTKARHGDRVLVSEKVDGTNVAVAKIDGQIVPLIRAGYRAASSGQEQHRLFDGYVMRNWLAFDFLLRDGERVCGEWLAMAHGIRYDLGDCLPFVAFDLIHDGVREPYDTFAARMHDGAGVLSVAPLLHDGAPIPSAHAMSLLGAGWYGAVDAPEGVVYRVEHRGRVDFLGKYVRPDFVPGAYFDQHRPDGQPVWNWHPSLVTA